MATDVGLGAFFRLFHRHRIRFGQGWQKISKGDQKGNLNSTIVRAIATIWRVSQESGLPGLASPLKRAGAAPDHRRVLSGKAGPPSARVWGTMTQDNAVTCAPCIFRGVVQV